MKSKQSILIVETGGSVSSEVCDVLNNLSIDVITATTSNKAIKLFATNKPSCVLIDIESSKLGGLKICSDIRNTSAGSSIPILVLADRNNQTAIVEGFNAGATDFILTPVNPILFSHRIQFVLKAGSTLEALEHNTEELTNIQAAGKIGVWSYDCDDKIFEFSQGFKSLLNWPQNKTFEIDDLVRLAPKSAHTSIQEHLSHPNRDLGVAIEIPFIPFNDTEPRKFLIKGRKVISDEASDQIIGTIQDISQTRRYEQEIFDISNLLRLAANATNMAFITIDLKGYVTHFEAGNSIGDGYEPYQVIGKHSSEVFDDDLPIQEILTRTSKGENVTIEYNHKDSIYEIRTGPLFDREEQINGFVAIAIDVTKRVRTEEQLRFIAQYDKLTGLPNRALFQDRLQHAIRHAQRKGHQVGLLFFDLDHFKKVNDTFGHNVGDKLLIEVAERVKSVIRSSDTLARLGGDEFTVIVENDATEKRCSLIAKKILTVLKVSFLMGGHEVFISSSVGITIFPLDGDTPEKLLKNADAAMYESKRNGRDRCSYYSSELNRYSIEQLKLENDLRYAISLEQFELYYQPKIDLKSGRTTGAEALIRWHHPERGIIPPDVFIPILESSGLIVTVGEWVIRTASQQLRLWHDSGHPELKMAVNLSARQFSEHNLPRVISSILEDSGIDPHSFEVEITESMLMENLNRTIEILIGIKNLGVQISIDDFGTGYSSLEYLKKLPIHTIKIDRSFISDILTNADDMAITTAIVAMAQGLQLKVVAEGIEQKGQLEKLKLLGCDEAQGYLFSPPVPASEFSMLLEQAKLELAK
ncbi:MAG: EAL domain-containing protein [Pseudomonadales bacterium]|nr:EAL domain-containing protein [Pseudomonadales bacterium]